MRESFPLSGTESAMGNGFPTVHFPDTAKMCLFSTGYGKCAEQVFGGLGIIFGALGHI
jgi:hypothetical protein